MKIGYKKKRRLQHLIPGLVWLVFGSITIIIYPNYLLNCGYILMGFLYMLSFLYEKNTHYLILDNGTIQKNYLNTKKINLDDIKEIKEIAGDIILKTASSKMRINTETIDNESLIKLREIFENLNLASK